MTWRTVSRANAFSDWGGGEELGERLFVATRHGEPAAEGVPRVAILRVGLERRAQTLLVGGRCAGDLDSDEGQNLCDLVGVLFGWRPVAEQLGGLVDPRLANEQIGQPHSSARGRRLVVAREGLTILRLGLGVVGGLQEIVRRRRHSRLRRRTSLRPRARLDRERPGFRSPEALPKTRRQADRPSPP